MTYLLLNRAKKNLGDFLILTRARQLLDKFLKSEYDLKTGWQTLNNIPNLNEYEGIIIYGGPAIQRDLYPGIYPLLPNLDDIKIPIYAFGVGWSSLPGDEIDKQNYRLTQQTNKLLEKINQNGPIGCRDQLTVELLQSHNHDAILTGCPAWYDLNYINKKFKEKTEITKIAFTPPQNQLYQTQSIELMKTLRNHFSDAEILCSFHRGFSEDEFTSESESKRFLKIKKVAESLEIQVENMSFEIENLEKYDKCDLHIGYRLHGHIFFLSQRKPSILINEDSRGRGFSYTTNTENINAYKINNKPLYRQLIRINPNKYVNYLIREYLIKSNDQVTHNVIQKINDEQQKAFSSFKGLELFYQQTFDTMQALISRI